MITDQAPYAPTDGVIAVLDKYRETGLGGNRITPELVKRLSIGATVADRVVLALHMLDLIEDDGTPTDTFIQFKQATNDAYQGVFREVLLNAYEPVFAITGQNLSDKTPAEIEDAFRTFKPESLRKRMVSLFLGLCSYAGLIEEAPVRRRAPRPAAPRRPSGGRTPQRQSRNNGGGHTTPPPSNTVFGVSDEDIAALTEEEFASVWNALGTVARARARAAHQPEVPSTAEVDDQE